MLCASLSLSEYFFWSWNFRKSTGATLIPISLNFSSKSISKYSQIDWNDGHFYFYEDEIQTIHKNNVLLFGDAGFSFEPHLAQVGNNIIEDANYLKFLVENNSLAKLAIRDVETFKRDKKDFRNVDHKRYYSSSYGDFL